MQLGPNQVLHTANIQFRRDLGLKQLEMAIASRTVFARTNP